MCADDFDNATAEIQRCNIYEKDNSCTSSIGKCINIQNQLIVTKSR